MKHVPVQILSATDTVGLPIYIEIDSAATCSYIILWEADKHKFHTYPNNQFL